MTDDRLSVPQGRIIEFNQTARKIAHNGLQNCSAEHIEGENHTPSCNKLAHAIGVALFAAYIRGKADSAISLRKLANDQKLDQESALRRSQ